MGLSYGATLVVAVNNMSCELEELLYHLAPQGQGSPLTTIAAVAPQGFSLLGQTPYIFLPLP